MLENHLLISQADLEAEIVNQALPSDNGEWFGEQIGEIRGKEGKYELFSHSARVAFIAVEVAKYSGTDEEDLALLARAGLLHDVGKTELPDKLFSEPAKTEEDMKQIRTHLLKSHNKVVVVWEHVAKIIVAHHEFQKNAYPRERYRYESTDPKLQRLQLFLALADETDAMMTKRPYHEPMTPEETKEKLMEIFDNESLIDLAIRTRSSILI